MRSSLRLYSSAAFVLTGLIAVQPAVAQTIQDTLSTAYGQNTQLGGARAQQRATDEQVPQALSNWRPTVTVTGAITRTHSDYSPPVTIPNAQGKQVPEPGTFGYNTEKTVGVQVVQNLYRGGRTEAQNSQAADGV